MYPWDTRSIGIRWTIGDVSTYGFDALRLSLWGAFAIFGRRAEYAVCTNGLPLGIARERTGEVPDVVRWHDASLEVPAFLQPHFDARMAEGVGWKLAPLRLFPDRYELALDNDCILWRLPAAMRAWLECEVPSCLLAEDVRACFGRFSQACGPAPRNTGIRGLPPRFALDRALQAILHEEPAPMTSELDEQGLQVAALTHSGPVQVVRLRDVAICSPFPPHLSDLGFCGAHFVGLNAHALPFRVDDRPGEDVLREHWRRHLPELQRRVSAAR